MSDHLQRRWMKVAALAGLVVAFVLLFIVIMSETVEDSGGAPQESLSASDLASTDDAVKSALEPSMEFDARDADKHARELIGRALGGDLSVFNDAVALTDQCGNFSSRAPPGSTRWVPPSADSGSGGRWRAALADLERTCRAWLRAMPDAQRGREALFEAAARAATAQGVPLWVVDPNTPVGDPEAALRHVGQLPQPSMMRAGITRLIAVDSGRAFVAQRGLDPDSVLPSLVANYVTCKRLGECEQRGVERLFACLDLYACDSPIRADRIAASGLGSRSDEEQVRRMATLLQPYLD